MKKFSVVIVALIAFCGFSQKITDYNRYKWAEEFNPNDFENTELTEDEEAIVVLDRSIVKYIHFVRMNQVRVALKRIDHLVYRISKESAIEKMNRIYLSDRKGKCKSIKVRTIDPQGRVVEFDESKLEEIKLNEGSSSYKILAIPGIQANSWVEVLIEYESAPGSMRFLVDHPFNTRFAEVAIVGVKEMKFSDDNSLNVKGYNGFKKSEVNEEDVDILAVYRAESISVAPNEKYMHEYNELTRLDYTMQKRDWDSFSSAIYRNVLNVRGEFGDKGFNSSAAKVFKEIGLTSEMEPLDKLRLIEKFVKEQINLINNDGAIYEAVKMVLKKRVANETGVIRTFRALLKSADIDFEVYLVEDKDYVKMDNEFPFSMGLTEFIFYFPSLKVYCIPANGIYYSGAIPNFIGGCQALRITDEPSNLKLRVFPYAEKEYNYEGTFSTISFDLDEEITKIEKTKKFYGDRAIRSRGYLNYADETEKKEYLEDLMISELEETTSTPIVLRNESINLNFNSTDTLFFESTLTSESILTPISNGFLLEFPQVIGKQTSFYEEDERVHDLFVGRSIVYRHEITVEIPEGYDLLDYENHRKSASCKDSTGRIFASFESKSRIKGNQLIIEIDEFYEEGHFPKSLVKEYQKVINAAYEFYISTSRLVKKN